MINVKSYTRLPSDATARIMAVFKSKLAGSPRPVVYTWGCANDDALDALLQAAGASGAGNQVRVAAGAAELGQSGKTYAVRVRATDFLGNTGQWATLMVLRAARAVPQVLTRRNELYCFEMRMQL